MALENEQMEFAQILSSEQLERCSPVKRAIAKLASDGAGIYIPTPKEVWDEDGLRIEDLARLADKSELRDLLHDLAMLARTINLQSKRTGHVLSNEPEEALKIARKIRDLVVDIGNHWKKYAQDVFVSPLENVDKGGKAEARMYDVCEALRVRIDQAREGFAHVDSRPRATAS